MLLLGDCNDHLMHIRDNSIDLIVSDPPYGLEFMGKDWDRVVVPTETWKECYRVLKPGKLAFIMCSPRQDVLSRMIVNLQDAGFRTNYTSIYWTFASGFPKAANISKLIDKKAGAERTEGDIIRDRWNGTGNTYERAISNNQGTVLSNSKPATEEAKKMEGAYVGFQPKPAVEVILVASKGKTLTWLDDCRIPYQSEDDKDIRPNLEQTTSGDQYRYTDHKRGLGNEKGRFPANLLVQDDVLNDGKIYKSSPEDDIGKGFGNSDIFGDGKPIHRFKVGDSGSYSRYFSLDSWWNKTFPFLIVPKASKGERNNGLNSMEPVKVNDGRNTPVDNPFQRGETLRTNSHPTVKPLKLMSYLITLGSREGDLILDPFCGSGTVCIASHQLHRKWIGIEKNPEYAEIIKKRLADPLAQLKLTAFA